MTRVLAPLTLVLAVEACGSTATPASQTIDGFAIGPARAVSGDEFHRLEATARDVVRSAWPGSVLTGIQLVSAGTLVDGSVQAGTEGPFTFLVVIDVTGEDRHALVLECDDATFPQPDSCAPASSGTS